MARPEKPMVRHLAITKARINLGEVVKRVHRNKEYVVLEKGGLAVVAIMDIDEFEDYLEQNDPAAREHIRVSSEEHRAGKGRPVDELIKELGGEVSEPPDS